MKVVYSEEYYADIGIHVFPLEKYHLIKERLIADRIINCADLVRPGLPDLAELARVHDAEYLEDLRQARPTRRLLLSEIEVSKELIDGQVLSAGGTHDAVLLSRREGVCYHDGGGFHHAFPDHAEGFCYVNDVAYAAAKLLDSGSVERVAVIDCDLHQGNGTAFIFRNEPRVFTFSIHQENLYPLKQHSDLDIGLEDDAGDDVYLGKLRTALDQIFGTFHPEQVLYVAGADPYAEDQLGNLGLSIEGLKHRDAMVLGACALERIPVAIVLGGGYARDVNDTVTIHVNTARIAQALALGSAGDTRLRPNKDDHHPA